MNICDICNQKLRKCLALLAGFFQLFWIAAPAVQAHELWIEPTQSHFEKNETLRADLRIGDMFVGSSMIYLSGQTERLALLTRKGRKTLSPRDGNRPVFLIPGEAPGHVMLVYQSTSSYVRYETADKFFTFADKKGADWVRDHHASHGFPSADFVERYKRFAKASVTIDDRTPSSVDSQIGMEVEFTLLDIQQTDNGTSHGIQLTRDGTVMADAPLTLFARQPDGTVSTSRHRTDSQGIFTALAIADHDYLLDHVTLHQIDPDQDRNGAIWESLWASLTFSGPDSNSGSDTN